MPAGRAVRRRAGRLRRRLAGLALAAAGLTAPAGGDVPRAWSQSLLDTPGDGRRAFVARPEAGTVVAVDVPARRVLWETTVGARPGPLQVLTTPDGGARVLVAVEGDHAVVTLDPESGARRARLPVGATPRGFAVVRDRYLVVALYAVHQIAVWDLAAGRVTARVPVDRFPAGVASAAGSDRLYVSHFFSGDLTVLAARDFTVAGRIEGDPAAGQPAGLLPDAGGRRLFVSHLRSRSHRSDPHFASAVAPVVGVVDLEAGEYRRAARLRLAFLDRPVNGPGALAWFRAGRGLIATNTRSNDLSVVDLTELLALAHVEVGRFPAGIVTTPDGREAWVANAHAHALSVVDLTTFRETARVPYGAEPLPPLVARGRDLFHDADSPRMAHNQWISCSNCHPGGHGDGRTWQLPGKPRLRTKDLHGLGQTLPAGWQATQDEMQDEELFIRSFHRGTGLAERPPHPALGPPNAGLSPDLDALSAYVYGLRHAVSPYTEQGRLTPAARRGRRLFTSARLQCMSCHPPPRYTISALEDNRRFTGLVTPRPDPALALDVPTLLGLYARPRYLHDGRAGTVAEIFTRWNREERHGRTRHLSPDELRDLERFLLSLPYAAEE